MNTIEQEIELIQKQIEQTTNLMTKSFLLLKKIDLLRIQEAQKKVKPTVKEIFEQLRKDIQGKIYKEVIDSEN